MNAEPAVWLRYAVENVQAASLCLESGLYYAAIQNAQQAAEKALKALCHQSGIEVKKTHSIDALCRALLRTGVNCEIAEEECSLLDSLYLPSKYPLGSVLPDFEPDEEIAAKCVDLAKRAVQHASDRIHMTG